MMATRQSDAEKLTIEGPEQGAADILPPSEQRSNRWYQVYALVLILSFLFGLALDHYPNILVYLQPYAQAWQKYCDSNIQNRTILFLAKLPATEHGWFAIITQLIAWIVDRYMARIRGTQRLFSEVYQYDSLSHTISYHGSPLLL